MKCPKCRFDNPEGAKFCNGCGRKLELACPECGKVNPLGSRFCNECGQRLKEVEEAEKKISETEGERKYVTVLFSDLSGYTAMSEKLDPEELKEITSRIFGEISKVIDKYEGFVEKFVGDAVMALFGVPKAHEDDPIRAIKVAREIHELVHTFSPEVEKKIGQGIAMHSGINSGLVVTGEIDFEKGTHGVAGDTVNIASRLCSLGKAGEILVGPDTYRQVEGHFTFESLEPTTVKGKTEPIQVHKALSAKERPVTIHRLSGLRADLVGRKVEMARLRDAVGDLKKGKGSIFSICGGAGTGKSRLVEEFKAALDLKEIQWLEGHGYPYAQNIPYFPMIDLLNRAFQIEEGHPPEKVRQRVESGVGNLVGKKLNIISYVGTLYALSYPELEHVSPELGKARLQDAIQAILLALAQRAPTVFFLEDLQWADAAFLELLRKSLLEIRHPAIVLCVHRPIISLFTTHQLGAISKIYHEIRLQDLSTSEAQDMVESLLKTKTIPKDLKQFIQDKAEGNPFYLEELVNSLIESRTLIRDNGSWRVTRSFRESQIYSTIQGLISGRLDHLGKETKWILREASVIGRTFLYEILKRVTEPKQPIETCLRVLEQHDLIRTKALKPELEYVFKHALTQEVVYNGLLRKERQEIHERVGLVMEQLFQDRLPELYETLAFHFKQSTSTDKAVDYLIKSGEKSFWRYALEEADKYYREAFNIVSKKHDKTKDDKSLIITVLTKWAEVLHYRVAYGTLIKIIEAQKDLVEDLDDKSKKGKIYAHLGFALGRVEKLRDSYEYLSKSLKLGEEIGDNKLIAFASARLAHTCADMGLLDDAIVLAERAQTISKLYETDQELFLVSLNEMGFVHFVRGERKKVEELGKVFLNIGQRQSNPRYSSLGHLNVGYGHMVAGNFSSAIDCFQKAIKVSLDPIISSSARLLLGYAQLAAENFHEAEKTLWEVLQSSKEFGTEFIGTAGKGFLGVVLMAKGNLSQGVRIVEEALQAFLENESKYRYAATNLMLGNVYLRMVQGARPKSISFIARNIGFLIKNIPVASKKAEFYFENAITAAKQMGAKSLLGQAYLNMGLLYREKSRTDQALQFISEASQLFRQCNAEMFLTEAKKELASMK